LGICPGGGEDDAGSRERGRSISSEKREENSVKRDENLCEEGRNLCEEG
jgi:hypothetical protein